MPACDFRALAWVLVAHVPLDLRGAIGKGRRYADPLDSTVPIDLGDGTAVPPPHPGQAPVPVAGARRRPPFATVRQGEIGYNDGRRIPMRPIRVGNLAPLLLPLTLATVSAESNKPVRLGVHPDRQAMPGRSRAGASRNHCRCCLPRLSSG